MKISLERARSLFLKKQLLRGPALPEGKTGVLRAIDQLGYVQIDTINVIERSHHIVFFTRSPDYTQDFLHDLQANDKKIFEYWAHAASFIPMKDYRFYLRTIQKQPEADSWIAKWTKENRSLIREVRKRVTEEGPLSTSDFPDIDRGKRGSWWGWKPAKMALEVLFWQGILMIKERKNFQRIYDITERVLPKHLDTTKPSEQKEKEFFIRKALGALGVATERDINGYIKVAGRLKKWIDRMFEAGEILKIEIEGVKRPYHILKDDLKELERNKAEVSPGVSLLSPFDNSIILRDRTSALFGFDYSLECYVPKKKRKYGYFCLPILWGSQLVGRIDPKADRQNKVLIINNLHLEKGNLDYDAFLPALSLTLNDFARFHKCQRIHLNKQVPPEIRRKILV